MAKNNDDLALEKVKLRLAKAGGYDPVDCAGMDPETYVDCCVFALQCGFTIRAMRRKDVPGRYYVLDNLSLGRIAEDVTLSEAILEIEKRFFQGNA